MADKKTESKFDKGIFMQLRGGRARFVVKVEDGQYEAGDADKKLLSVRKRIIDCDEYREIVRVRGEAKAYLKSKAVYCPYLADSMFLIRIDEVGKVIDKMDEFSGQDRDAVEAFLAVYEDAKAEARKQLKNLYDENDYPTAAEVRRSFRFDWEFKDAGQVFGVPSKLKEVKAALYTAQVRRALEREGDVEETIKYALREEVQGLVAHLADRLSPDAKGERKVLRQSAVENLNEFLNAFPSKNMMDDADCARFVEQCRRVLQGVDVKELKDDAKAQEKLAADMARVREGIDKMMEKRPTRLIGGEI
jgi:hypothetical protein